MHVNTKHEPAKRQCHDAYLWFAGRKEIEQEKQHPRWLAAGGEAGTKIPAGYLTLSWVRLGSALEEFT